MLDLLSYWGARLLSVLAVLYGLCIYLAGVQKVVVRHKRM